MIRIGLLLIDCDQRLSGRLLSYPVHSDFPTQSSYDIDFWCLPGDLIYQSVIQIDYDQWHLFLFSLHLYVVPFFLLLSHCIGNGARGNEPIFNQNANVVLIYSVVVREMRLPLFWCLCTFCCCCSFHHLPCKCAVYVCACVCVCARDFRKNLH